MCIYFIVFNNIIHHSSALWETPPLYLSCYHFCLVYIFTLLQHLKCFGQLKMRLKCCYLTVAEFKLCVIYTPVMMQASLKTLNLI